MIAQGKQHLLRKTPTIGKPKKDGKKSKKE